MRAILALTVVFALGIAAPGASSMPMGAVAQRAPVKPAAAVTGRLQSVVTLVESTGWTIATSGGAVEADVRAVLGQARQLNGRRVTAFGRFELRRYWSHTARVLVVTRLVAR